MFQAGLRPAIARLYDPFDAMLARQGAIKRPRAEHEPKTARTPGLGQAALRRVLRRPNAMNELVELAGTRVLGGALLVTIFEGTGDGPSREQERARAIVEAGGGRYEGEGAARRWLQHRYSVSYRQAPIFASGAFVDTMEVAASWSRLGALYDGVRKAMGEHVFVMAHFNQYAYPDGCCIYLFLRRERRASFRRAASGDRGGRVGRRVRRDVRPDVARGAGGGHRRWRDAGPPSRRRSIEGTASRRGARRRSGRGARSAEGVRPAPES